MDIMLMQTGDRDTDMQRALSDGLRRRREIGQLGQLTGDEVLAPFGKGLSLSADREIIKEMDRSDKQSQRELTSGYYDFQKAQAGLSQTMALRKQDETERHNLAMEGKVNTALQKTLDRDVMKLSANITKAQLPDLQAGISQIDDELRPYLENDEGLPGMGGLSNIGDWSFTEGGRAMKARVAKIRNMILKARSGGAVTPSEASRLLTEFSLGVMNTDEDFLRSWTDFKEQIARGEQNIYAGFTDEVKDTYLMNLSREGGIAPTNAPGSGGNNRIDFSQVPQ
jgi:hypothetical protein